MIGFSLLSTLLMAAAALPAGPLDFKARDMRIEPQEHRVVLQGDVQLSRGDLNVTGQHAVAEYGLEHATAQKPRRRGQSALPEAGLGGQTVQRFTVRGNVHVRRGSRTAEGEQGVVDVPAQTLVLTGTPDAPPVVRDGSELLSGERILLRLDSEDVDVIRPKLVLKRSLAEDGQAKPTPVRVEADHLILLQGKRLARFTDDVVVRRGDAVVRSPRMEARYDADGQLTRLELRGGVDVRQGERRATGETADYDAQARTLVLLGEPKLYDQGDVLTGDRIDLGLDSKEVRVERARGRLRPEAHKGERGAQ